MTVIYLPKSNFNLKEKSYFLPHLKEAGISSGQYKRHIQPFLESLTGFYNASGPQLRRLFLFPKMEFIINGLSLSKTLGYVSGDTNFLGVPIQDGGSLDVESLKGGNVGSEDQHLIHRGLAIKKYDKQVGSIDVSRVNGVETRGVVLEKILKMQVPVPTSSLSEDAIDRILG